MSFCSSVIFLGQDSVYNRCRATQVFIHDPLYKWAISPKGAERRQRDDIAADNDALEGMGAQQVATTQVYAVQLTVWLDHCAELLVLS